MNKGDSPQCAYTIIEVCHHTKLGRTKVYQLISDGLLKARKIGKRTIVLRTDLEEFLNSLEPYNSKNTEG